VKKLLFLGLVLYCFQLRGQPRICNYKPPFITIHFASGNIPDLNRDFLANYFRRSTSCPSDGYYSYVPYTSGCFNNDWHTIEEDHTPGDVDGNMMLVNGAPESGTFLKTTLNGFKSNTSYQFSVWLMNLCKPTKKCPFPLLANITIRLETPEGKLITQFKTGDLIRVPTPVWKEYRGDFTMPAGVTSVALTMIDNVPGGCGNDFALDDIAFRECVVQPLPELVKTPAKTTIKTKTTSKPIPVTKNKTPAPVPATREPAISNVRKPQSDSRPVISTPSLKLTTRTNDLVKEIQTGAGEIKIDLYDNGEIDNDTISIFHNNELIVARARLSDRAITLKISIDADKPRHELIMVAENLGSIPPNTSLMIVTAGNERYEVRISSTEQKNAKVVFVLKK
jgi:hypothetical protein